MRIASIHHCQTTNLGDRVCGPMEYFFKDAQVDRFPIRGLSARHVWSKGYDLIVVGGGAVRNAVDIMGASKPSDTKTKLVAWGVGASRHGKLDPPPFSLHTRRAYDLIGTREFKQGMGNATRFVPCVSCMDPAFDYPIAPVREAVLYINSDPGILNRYPLHPSTKDLPRMSNRHGLPETIRFLASAETVVTNSYHGAYWAQLLGRKVVLVGAYSSKFYGFPHAPEVAGDSGWRPAAARAVPYEVALTDARALNRKFYSLVRELVGGK